MLWANASFTHIEYKPWFVDAVIKHLYITTGHGRFEVDEIGGNTLAYSSGPCICLTPLTSIATLNDLENHKPSLCLMVLGNPVFLTYEQFDRHLAVSQSQRTHNLSEPYLPHTRRFPPLRP